MVYHTNEDNIGINNVAVAVLLATSVAAAIRMAKIRFITQVS